METNDYNVGCICNTTEETYIAEQPLYLAACFTCSLQHLWGVVSLRSGRGVVSNYVAS